MVDAFRRIKSVWNPNDPMGLHHAVEQLAFEGVSKKEIEDALITLLLEIREAGANDDTEEIINGVGDRLHGWCHPSCHIVTQQTISQNGLISNHSVVKTLVSNS